MIVSNKLESIKLIKELKLNSFPEKLFHRDEIDEVKKFLLKYPAEFYAVRSKEIINCKENNFKVSKDDVLNEIKKHNLFTINVSPYNYIDNFVLIGDIKIGKNNDVWFIGSTNLNFTGKMAEQNPDFNFSTDIFDKKLNKVPRFDLIYSYIVDHNLIDVIVEFAIYDKPVGIYDEPVVVFEIRTGF
ncbi:MAG: hypothetical protein HFJ12_07360 [Bacilli bacterium]|nr:hypothetical protein [Bacilli bacterium]